METTVAKDNQQKHFVLVHGACHGAWCWYKLKPLLESAGHRVTAIDLSASGINTKSLEEIHTLDDYAEPLLKLVASIPPDEKVILVGHSYGGYSVGLAIEKYPHKISVAAFVAAFMPDVVYSLEYICEQHQARSPENLDTQYLMSGGPEKPILTFLLGPKDLATNFYQLCSTQDLELAKFLVRPTPLLKEDFSNRKFSVEGYGSVKRVYIVCPEDKAVHIDFQQWLVENIVVEEVKVIEGADHMAMLSKPKDLCQSLLEIADKYI